MFKAMYSTSFVKFGLVIVIAGGCAEQKISSSPDSKQVVIAANAGSNKQLPSTEKNPESPAITETEPLVSDSNSSSVPDEKSANISTPMVDSSDSPAITKLPAEIEAKPNIQKGSFSQAAFFNNDVIGLIVVHPNQFIKTPTAQLLLDVGVIPENGKIPELDFKIDEVERVTFIFDKSTINAFASELGMPVAINQRIDMVAEGEQEVEGIVPMQLLNSLKQIGLAFNSYHDTFSRFPRADGDATGEHTGLSWRVHLLPFLGEAALYNQFNFNEEWDSDHNKALIAQMPDVFKSPGIDEDGKTAFHVFVGENTLFHGEQGPAILEITDGTSNTILAVLAGADTAEIWTKPGGLEVDLKDPKKAIGEIKGDELLAVFADGAVHSFPTNINEVTLANLVQPNDGKAIDIEFPGHDVDVQPPTSPWPSVIISFVNDADHAQILKTLLQNSTEEIHEGQVVHKNSVLNAIWFSDPKTLVVGTLEAVKIMISTKQSGTVSTSELIDRLQLKADFTAALDLETQADLIANFAQFNMYSGWISNVKSLTAEASVSSREGETLIEIRAKAATVEQAVQWLGLATNLLNMGKANLNQIPVPGSDAEKDVQDFFKQLADSISLKSDGTEVKFRVPKPGGVDSMLELLKPALVEAQAAAKETQKLNAVRQIGLAFHNYHDVHGAFPGSGRQQNEKPVGLSWRVHLLPYLNQVPLYNSFKLDEPWDSDHNKELIEKMPEIFKSPGVDGVGKTSFHVFIGPGSPFSEDKAPKLVDFTDGTSNTILMVVAGPDTAAVWTQPGGLDFDAENPIASLGNLIGETFQTLMADGSVRDIETKIKPKLLLKMIQHEDGGPVE